MSQYIGRHRVLHERCTTRLASVAARPTGRMSAVLLLSGALVSTVGITSASAAAPAAAAAAPAASPAVVATAVRTAPAANRSIVAIAASLSGIPYRYGGTTTAGFDCSGFTQYVYARAGKAIPRTVAAQKAAARKVSSPVPGNLVFFGTSHVGIYAGNGMMYDSPRTGRTTGLHPIYSKYVTYGAF